MVPQHMQCFTLNDSFSGSSSTPTTIKRVMPTKMRKSITASPATSSRSIKKEDSSDRRKSASAALCSITNSRKQSESTTMNRSSSNLSASTHNKSPGLVSRPTKNPKYAHVQSTIPKASGGKRKT